MPDDFSAAFEAARQQHESAPPPRPRVAEEEGECPIEPLGHGGGKYWFFDAAGQLRGVAEDKLASGATLISLLGGDTRWAVAAHPQMDREGNPTGWFSARGLGRDLVAACHRIGLFAADEPIRGYGVWSAEGQVMTHLGDVVLPLGGASRRAGFRDHGALWPALPRLGKLRGSLPAPASYEAVVRVEEMWRRWNWEQPYAPRIVTGIWAAGLFGAAIPWRPHCLIVGPAGSGKTTLMRAIIGLSPLGAMWNDFTEAGLRQALTGRAASIILDEAEGDAEGVNRLQKVVEFLRRASGGGGVQALRGSAGGTAQMFEVTANAILGAILPPVLMPQDESRFTRVDLQPRAEDGPGLPSEADLLALKLEAPAMFARALEALPRMLGNLALFRALLIKRGCAPRLADQLGTLMAARRAMLQDLPVTEEQAQFDITRDAALAVTAASVELEDGPGAVLAHLFASHSDATRNGSKPSIGKLISMARLDDADGDDARELLLEHGMAVVRWPPEAPGIPRSLMVANTHPALMRIFEGTRWAGGKWREDLRRLPGAVVPPTGQRALGKLKPRCTIVSADLLPERRRISGEEESN